MAFFLSPHSVIQQRDVFCTPANGLCAFGIQTNLKGNEPTSYNLTAYSSDCHKIGSTLDVPSEKKSFPSYTSQLPFTIETKNVDYSSGKDTVFQYAGLTFGGVNNGLKWGCATCNNGAAKCCGYAFVGPGCSPAWDKATCKTAPIADEAIDQALRWKSVDTDSAWAAAIADWNAQKHRGGLTFSAQISNFLHGPPEFNCADTSDGSGCRGGVRIQCNDKESKPAAHLILNSFLTISDLIMNMYTGIGNSQTDMNGGIGKFSSTFAPIHVQDQSVLDTILSIVGLGFSLCAGPIFGGAMKEFAYFAKGAEKAANQLKDTTNSLVSVGMPYATDAAKGSLDTQNELQMDMSNIVDAWKKALGKMKAKLFDGSPESIKKLQSMIADGKMLVPGNFADDLTIQKAVERALYAVLVPQAWNLSNQDIHPLVLDAGVACGANNPDFYNRLFGADANKNKVCIGDKLYYLLQVSGRFQTCSGGRFQFCTFGRFTGLPGADQLNGKSWGGLSKEDFVAGALAGYKANGNKNGWKTADPTNGDVMGMISSDVVRAPGIINIPICGSKEVFANWARRKSANYPCN